MDKVTSGSVLLRLLAFLFLHSALNVQIGNHANPVNQAFSSKDDSSIQNQILAFLLHKNTMPDREDVIGLEVASKLAELQELTALQEELSLERKMVSNAIEKERSMPSKRDEACFWKYCV